LKTIKKAGIYDNTWNMTERRKQMKGRISALYAGTRKRKELGKKYAALCKEVNKSVRKDYRFYIDSIANDAQTTENQGNIKAVFNSIRRLTKNIGQKWFRLETKKVIL
jgi:hypothetical protein